MASRNTLARAAAAVAGASVALMMSGAIPAGAEPAAGKVDPKGEVHGHHVNVGKGHEDMIASLVSFTLDDGTELKMYCVEIKTRINKKHAMVERPWDAYPNEDSPFNENRSRINWVLHHGYPVVDTAALTTLLTGQGVKLANGIDEKEAIAATQAAVWHYSDGTALDEKNPLPTGPRDARADVVALYRYLTSDANVGRDEQPTAALAVSPTELSGRAGERIGPFTVATTGVVEELRAKLPDGVKITDAAGAPLTADQITDGVRIFLDIPADAAKGDGSFELTGVASVDTGRLFISEDHVRKPTQALIVATAEQTKVGASARASWVDRTAQPSSSAAPVPQPKASTDDLAHTGASIFAPVVLGVVLVAAGVGALLFQRHRRRV